MTTKNNSATEEIWGEVVADLQELADTLRTVGLDDIPPKFVTRHVKIPNFPTLPPTGTAIRAVREQIGASQVVFARLISVSPSTVRAWERDAKKPSSIVLRYLADIRDRPEQWCLLIANTVTE